MQHFEFETYVGDDESVKIPPEVAAQIDRDCPVRVLVLFPNATEDRQWAEMTAARFLQGYAEADAIYDDVSAG